ncbi:MAG: hypothetical protein ABSB22_12745 [Thermodesulfobacteriota bacterium]
MTDKLDDYLDFVEFKSPQAAEELKQMEAFPSKRDKHFKLARATYANLGGDFQFAAFSGYKVLPEEGFPFANVLHGDKIIGLLKLVLKALVPLFGVFGASRTGKTMAVIYGILMPLIEKAKGIAGTIFDPEGQYKLHLCPKYPDDVLVFKANEFKMNPLIPPPALTAGEWKNHFASLWRSLNCGDAMVNMVVNQLDYLYANHSCPTFQGLKDRVLSLNFKPTERAYQHRESLLSRINWLGSIFGNSWNCQEGFRRGDIIDKWKIIETVGLDLVIANFFQDLLIEREKFSCTSFSDEPKELLVFEEAHFRFGSDFILKNTEVGERVSLGHLRTLAKYGFVTIVVDQVPSLLVPQLTANLSGVLCFRLNNSRCIQRISDLLNLSSEQRDEMATLESRKAVFFSHNCLPSPVLVQMPEFPIQSVRAEEVEPLIQKKIMRLYYVPSIKGTPGPEKKQPTQDNSAFTILNHFAIFPLTPIFYRCEELGISEEQIRKLISYLQENGWLGPTEDIPSGKPGKPMASALVLPDGLKVLGMPPEKYRYSKGKGGLAHRVLQRRIQEKVAGLMEHKGCDVYTSDGQKTTAYEIETEVHDSHEHWISNISRDLEFADHVVVVCLNQNDCKALKKKISAKLTNEILEKVSFATFKEVLKNAA